MDIKKMLGGLWRFTREIRSLGNEKQLMAQITEGKASFVTVQLKTVDDTPQEGTWILYRERGDLVNYQHPEASGYVHRQYWHCLLESNKSKVYFSEARDSQHTSVKDPWAECDEPLLSSNFKIANYFHDISFTEVAQVDVQNFTMQNPQYAKDACQTFIENQTKLQANLDCVALCPHLCGDDYYSGIYAVHKDGKLSTFWHIHGPEKAFTITTSYSKVHGNDEI